MRRRFAPRLRVTTAATAGNAELAALVRMLQEQPWPPDDGSCAVEGGVGGGGGRGGWGAQARGAKLPAAGAGASPEM